MALSLVSKISLGIRIWIMAGIAWWRMKGIPLPDLVVSWSSTTPISDTRRPQDLSRIVDRVLTVGGWQPRCIVRAMVLYRLLSRRGHEPALVIGMSKEPQSKNTHAWVELAGRDLGPRPGKGQLTGLATFDHNGAR
jgi:hypothetical protein